MGCFQEVPNSKIELFYREMILSDITMPHTSTHLSPVTFSQFLDRSQIKTFNTMAIYQEANEYWKELYDQAPNILSTGPRGENDLDMAERPDTNAWHVLIDYFRRALRVEKIKEVHFTMHYLAHVCRAFLEATSSIEDQRDMLCTRAIFTQMMNPILYESIVPAAYAFLPVKFYTDAVYMPSLQAMIARVKTYVTGHTAQYMQPEKLDEDRCACLKKELHSALEDIVKHKRNFKHVQDSMSRFANSIKIYKIDNDAFELSGTMKRDGIRSAVAIAKLDRLGNRTASGRIDDPEEIIDSLLDVWSIVSPPKKESLISKIGAVFKKPAKEEMDNDIDAIKRERKLPSA